jgi:AcrR family transcriptional regulator
VDTREKIRAAAMELFDRDGLERVSAAAICRAAGVSNGSFFHAFATKEALGADLFMSALEAYHAAMTDALADDPDAVIGVARLVRAHLGWVVDCRPMARFLFEQSRSGWLVHVRERQSRENELFAVALDRWRAPLVRAGALVDVTSAVFTAEIIGPAQIFCRAWLSGRSPADPREQADALINCALRALVA